MNKGSDGARLAVGIAEDHSDLGTSDAKTEEARTVSLEEASDGLLNILEADIELVDERHEDVRSISSAVLGLAQRDLDDVENVVDDTVRLRDEVGSHVTLNAARTNERADEEASIGRVLDTTSKVQVDGRRRDRHGGELEVLADPVELQLVGKSRFDVADGLLFGPDALFVGTEGGEEGVHAGLAKEVGDAANTGSSELLAAGVGVLGELASHIGVDKVGLVDDGNIEDVDGRATGRLEELENLGRRSGMSETSTQLVIAPVRSSAGAGAFLLLFIILRSLMET